MALHGRRRRGHHAHASPIGHAQAIGGHHPGLDRGQGPRPPARLDRLRAAESLPITTPCTCPASSTPGSYTFRVNPDIPVAYRNTDLRLGVNYCILSDGTQASPEFIIIIESANAPVLTSPASAASIKDLTPTFSWTGDAPFYALLVSDEPFKITAEGTVSGVSAIWQIITPYTSVRYGDADPSGFNSVPAPPLISGKTYNWLVLNNYGNNSASTSKVAPVPFSFVYSPAPPLASVQLLEPRDKDTIAGADRITFRWALVDGAVSYKVELLEENLVDGSQADIALWKASSNGGQVTLDNATGLLRRYNYKWRVYAIGNNGSASLSDKRSFFYAVDVGDISILVKNQAGQKVAYAPVKLNRLGGASSAVYQGGSTDTDGLLSIKNAPLGNYEARIENLDGYQSRMDTVAHTAKSGTTRNITLLPVLGRILGKVAAAGTGTGILNAKVTVTGSDGSEWTDRHQFPRQLFPGPALRQLAGPRHGGRVSRHRRPQRPPSTPARLPGRWTSPCRPTGSPCPERCRIPLPGKGSSAQPST